MAKIDDIKSRFDSSEATLKEIRDDSDFSWTDREALFLGQDHADASKEAKSTVNTQDLQNLVIDGSSRVMAQTPTGKVQAMTQKDKGKSTLMDIALHQYVLKNPYSAQYDWETKQRVWDMYSRIYGAMPMLSTWRVDKDYTGPDGYLIHPRHFRWQSGKTRIRDCDYVFVDNWVSIEWLKGRKGKVWQNIDKLVKDAKDSSAQKESEDQTYTEQNQSSSQIGETGKHGQVLLRTMYECDKWTTYAPDHDIIIREQDNPQGGGIPVVMKQCYPLLDRMYGLAEFERGKTLQYAINSLVNIYMDGMKMSVRPPIILNKNIVPSSIKYKPGAKWFETEQNSIREFNISPTGLNSFQSTYSFLKSALLNMGASSDTSVSKGTDPGMGKTPQALSMQAAREGARDNWDRKMMENAIEELYGNFVNMFGANQEQPINVDIFESEIAKIQALEEEDIATVFDSEEAGTAKIDAETFKEDDKTPTRFHYTIDAGTTLKNDEEKENQTLGSLMALFTKNPQIMEELAKSGKRVDMAELVKRYTVTSGAQDWDKIITDIPEEEMMPQEEQLPPEGMMPQQQQGPSLEDMMRQQETPLAPPPVEERLMANQQ